MRIIYSTCSIHSIINIYVYIHCIYIYIYIYILVSRDLMTSSSKCCLSLSLRKFEFPEKIWPEQRPGNLGDPTYPNRPHIPISSYSPGFLRKFDFSGNLGFLRKFEFLRKFDFSGKNLVFLGKIWLFWENLTFLRKFDFPEKIWLFWGNPTFLRKSDFPEKKSLFCEICSARLGWAQVGAAGSARLGSARLGGGRGGRGSKSRVARSQPWWRIRQK